MARSDAADGSVSADGGAPDVACDEAFNTGAKPNLQSALDALSSLSSALGALPTDSINDGVQTGLDE